MPARVLFQVTEKSPPYCTLTQQKEGVGGPGAPFISKNTEPINEDFTSLDLTPYHGCRNAFGFCLTAAKNDDADNKDEQNFHQSFMEKHSLTDKEDPREGSREVWAWGACAGRAY